MKLELADLKKNGKASNKQILKFKRDIMLFLSTLCAHLAEKLSIKFPLTRNLKCLIRRLLVQILMSVKLVLIDS